LISYSGGITSWGTAKLVIDTIAKPEDTVELLFADTLIEDPDLHRFLDETSEKFGVPITKLCDGRTPWEVFRSEKFQGDSRIDPCSRHLKRKLLWKYIKDNYSPEEVVIYLGLDANEAHRLERTRESRDAYTIRAPLVENDTFKESVFEWLKECNIEPPSLYGYGFSHNNCGGFCIKSGQGQFKLLMDHFPERYEWHIAEQEKTFKELGKRHPFIRKMINGKVRYLSLADFRRRVKAGEEFDKFELGGCGCAID